MVHIKSCTLLTTPTGQTTAFLRSVNPHLKYIDLNRRGYMLVDVTRERAVAEWWYVDTVASVTNIQSFGVAFETVAGCPHSPCAARDRHSPASPSVTTCGRPNQARR